MGGKSYIGFVQNQQRLRVGLQQPGNIILIQVLARRVVRIADKDRPGMLMPDLADDCVHIKIEVCLR